MNALRAVPTPDPPPNPGDAASTGVDAELDLAPDSDEAYQTGEEWELETDPRTDPRTDPESLTLCALMWSTDTDSVRRITSVLVPADFAEPAYAELFTVIADLVTEQQPHDPASVAAVLHRVGVGQKDAPLRRALADVVTANAPGGVSAVHYADIVLSQSYRRSFHIAGQRLVQAAEEGPEDDLFDYMVQLGTAQRAAWKRLNTFRAGTERS